MSTVIFNSLQKKTETKVESMIETTAFDGQWNVFEPRVTASSKLGSD